MDSKQFKKYNEIWQTSIEAYSNLRGDCEDHAILLTDWLISLGYDARVVIGRYRNEGHAWVVLFHESDVYLIESTNKRTKRAYPYARYMPDYHPEAMFNREYLWENMGSKFTTDYQSKSWVLKSRFYPQFMS